MLHSNFLERNERAQVAETITWFVATIIIIVILLISIFLASLVGKTKTFPYVSRVDLFAKNSFTSYLLTKDTAGLPIYYELSQQGSSISSFDKSLASSVFGALYSSYYTTSIYIGTLNPNGEIFGIPNLPVASVAVIPSGSLGPMIYYKLSLGNNKFVQLILWKSN